MPLKKGLNSYCWCEDVLLLLTLSQRASTQTRTAAWKADISVLVLLKSWYLSLLMWFDLRWSTTLRGNRERDASRALGYWLCCSMWRADAQAELEIPFLTRSPLKESDRYGLNKWWRTNGLYPVFVGNVTHPVVHEMKRCDFNWSD